MLSVELCGVVYVIGAVVVTVVVVVVSGADVSAFAVVVVNLVVVVSALELSLLVGISIAPLVFYRLAVVDLLDALYITAEIKSVPIPVAP